MLNCSIYFILYTMCDLRSGLWLCHILLTCNSDWQSPFLREINSTNVEKLVKLAEHSNKHSKYVKYTTYKTLANRLFWRIKVCGKWPNK